MANNERIRFAGDPVPAETGAPGSQPNIPLSATVAPITEEKLPLPGEEKKEEPRATFKPNPGRRPVDPSDEDDEDDEITEQGPTYTQERIGARIGIPLEEQKKVEEVEEELDNDDIVPCMFQHEVRVQDKGLMHIWGPGVHNVPVSLAGRTMKERHWYLKQHKVRHVGPVQKNPNNREFAEVDD